MRLVGGAEKHVGENQEKMVVCSDHHFGFGVLAGVSGVGRERNLGVMPPTALAGHIGNREPLNLGGHGDRYGRLHLNNIC